MVKTLLTASALLFVSSLFVGCASDDVTTNTPTPSPAAIAGGAASAIHYISPALTAEIKKLATDHPGAVKYLPAVAKAMEDTALVLGKAPSPDEIGLYLIWTQFDPKVAAYATAFEDIYAKVYPALKAGTPAVKELADDITSATSAQ